MIQVPVQEDFHQLACRVGLALAHAIEIIWEAKIVHRDIKPENIFLEKTPNGNVKQIALGDFGVAQTFKDTQQLSTSQRFSQSGTAIYMSPEQVSNRLMLDFRSDLYSVGLVMYEIVYGNSYKYSDQYLDPKLPLTPVLQKLLQNEPKNRYQTPKALKEELKNIGGGRFKHSEKGLPSPGLKPDYTTIYLSVVLGLLMVMIIAIVGGIYWEREWTLVNGGGSSNMRLATATATSTPVSVSKSTPLPPATELPIQIACIDEENIPEVTFDRPDLWDTRRANFSGGQLLLQDTEDNGSRNNPSRVAHAKLIMVIEDFILDVNGKWIGGLLGGQYGIRFRLQEQGFYEFLIGNDKRYVVHKYLTQPRQYVSLEEGFSDAINVSHSMNHIHIEMAGNEMRFLVNDQLITSVEDTEFRKGDIWLVAHTPTHSNSFEVAFDDFEIVVCSS